MSENNDIPEEGVTPPEPSEPAELTPEELVEAAIKERLKPIKEKLDKAYSSRDEALKQLEEYQKAERKREQERLIAEGKEKEALQLQLEEVANEKAKLESQVISLTRDIELKGILSSYDFQSPRAIELAFKDLVSELEFKENTWRHKSGVSMKDAVTAYLEDDSNKFLLKQPESNGPGIGAIRSRPAASQPQSLFKLSQAEVLKMAQEGKLGR